MLMVNVPQMRNKHITSTILAPFAHLHPSVASPQALRRRFVALSACSATWQGSGLPSNALWWSDFHGKASASLLMLIPSLCLVGQLVVCCSSGYLVDLLGWLVSCYLWLVVHENQCCSIPVVSYSLRWFR